MAVPHLTATAGPEPTQTVIDDDHLRQMTLGDRGLEREVLEIFIRQAALMLRRISGAKPALAAAAAHTLKGSARGIGAWRVAHAADRLEQTAAGGGDSLEAFKAAIAELETASREARAAILARLADRSDGAGAEASGRRARDDCPHASTGAPQPKSIEEAAATPAIYGAVRRAPVSLASRFQSWSKSPTSTPRARPARSKAKSARR